MDGVTTAPTPRLGPGWGAVLVGVAHAQTADQSKTCAPVSPCKTVQLNGINMTPAQAYAAAGNQADSDA